MTASYGYGDAHYYDLWGDRAGEDQPDVRYYARRAHGCERALEIGAGTGRVALHLAARGVSVYCVEPSREMRAALLTKLAQRRELYPQVTILPTEGAMFELGRRVPLAYAAGVLQHFLTDEEMLALLRNVHRHLEPAGLFCFEARSGPTPDDTPPIVLGDAEIGELRYRATYRMRTLCRDLYKFDIRYEILRGEELLETSEKFSVGRYVWRDWMRELAQEAGFEVAAEWSDYDGAPYTGEGERVVMEVRKRGG
jgi:SAM-dependent methyltransferase